MMNKRERYRGSLLGLAVGDAVGAAVEFKAPGTFPPVTGMTGGGPLHLAPGEWTDDTSMALCLAESLVEKRGFDAADQMDRYVAWYRRGLWSCKGYCFDIGNATREALERYEHTGEPFAGTDDPRKAGNGSIMRLAPVPLFYAETPDLAVYYAGESSRTTHAAREAVDACRFLGALIAGAVQGASKESLLGECYEPAEGIWDRFPLSPSIVSIAKGSYKTKNPPDIRGAGYVVHSLEAALWAFYNSSSFGEGMLLAVNLGEDADTTGAVYGQLAGAYYGVDGIPGEWLTKLAMRDRIDELAGRLFRNRHMPGSRTDT